MLLVPFGSFWFLLVPLCSFWFLLVPFGFCRFILGMFPVKGIHVLGNPKNLYLPTSSSSKSLSALNSQSWIFGLVTVPRLNKHPPTTYSGVHNKCATRLLILGNSSFQHAIIISNTFIKF